MPIKGKLPIIMLFEAPIYPVKVLGKHSRASDECIKFFPRIDQAEVVRPLLWFLRVHALILESNAMIEYPNT